MFLFSPRFDWSFSNLPRFNWGCWTLPKCSYFTQMFLILPKIWMKFLVCPNLMKAAGITTWFQFTHGQCGVYFAIGAKNDKMVSDYFAVLAIILPLIWLLLCLSLENRHYLITCECSCILCPNFENFCPNNGQFFSVGDATASPCCMLMSCYCLTSVTACACNGSARMPHQRASAPLACVAVSVSFLCVYTSNSGVRRKFSWGVSFSGIWWSFIFGVRCLWRHNLMPYPCFQTNVLVKFVDIICIFVYMSSP